VKITKQGSKLLMYSKRVLYAYWLTLANPYWRANGKIPTALQTAKVAPSQRPEPGNHCKKTCEDYKLCFSYKH
jgi:hypothetical protein